MQPDDVTTPEFWPNYQRAIGLPLQPPERFDFYRTCREPDLARCNAPTVLAQCQDLMRRAAGYPRPTVVAGDFNLKKDRGSPSMRDCDPPGFSRRGDGSVQHVDANDTLTFT